MKNKIFSWGTSLIELSKLKDQLALIPDFFFPSLIQRCIEKRFEIRTFYLDGKFFSSAILSQNDEKTIIDFRNYNSQKPNRTPPIKLPSELEQKLILLFNSIGMNSGSFDLLYGVDKKFYFLKINPIGQFWQVSYPCNYYIEREISKYLSNE